MRKNYNNYYMNNNNKSKFQDLSFFLSVFFNPKESHLVQKS